MKHIFIIILFAFSLNAQEVYLFDSQLIDSISPTTGLYEIEVANFDQSYYNYNYLTVEGTTIDNALDSLSEYILGKYDEEGYSFFHYNENRYLRALDRNAYEATLDRVIDGDTYWINVQVPDQLGMYETVRVKLRLYACDTYEKTSRRLYNHDFQRKETNQERDLRRDKAYQAKRYVEALLTDSSFKIIYKHKYRDSRIVGELVLENGVTMKTTLKRANLLTGKYEQF